MKFEIEKNVNMESNNLTYSICEIVYNYTSPIRKLLNAELLLEELKARRELMQRKTDISAEPPIMTKFGDREVNSTDDVISYETSVHGFWDGKVESFEAGFAFFGGYTIEIGRVEDRHGASRWFFSHGPTIGHGVSLQYNHQKIVSRDNAPTFNIDMYQSRSSGYQFGGVWGASFRGNMPLDKTPKQGFYDFGTEYYEIGYSRGLSTIGGWWSRKETTFLK